MGPLLDFLKVFGNNVWALIVGVLLLATWRLWQSLEAERKLHLETIEQHKEALLEKEEACARELKEANVAYLEKLETAHGMRIHDAEKFADALSRTNEKVHETVAAFSRVVEVFESSPRRR